MQDDYFGQIARKSMHFIVDQTVPKSVLIACVASYVGWITPRYIETRGVQHALNFYDSYVSNSWMGEFFFIYYGPEVINFAKYWGGIGAAMATSLLLNKIAISVFWIISNTEKFKEQLNRMKFFQRFMTSPLKILEKSSNSSIKLGEVKPSVFQQNRDLRKKETNEFEEILSETACCWNLLNF